MSVSIHFSRDEFIRSKTALERGIDNSLPESLSGNLQATIAGCERVRAYLGKPMLVRSGYRCKALNDAIGGSANSQHMNAQAVDFVCPGFGPPAEIAKALLPALKILGIDQLIQEGSWVHISFTMTPRYQALTCVSPGKYIEGV